MSEKNTIEIISDHRLTKELLKRKDDGSIKKHIENIYLILKEYSRLKGKIKYNEFANRIEKMELMPYGGGIGEWSDLDEDNLRLFLTQEFSEDGIPMPDPGKELVTTAVNIIAHENRFHPLKEYLDNLKWDGVPRIGTWLQKYLNATDEYDNVYINSVGTLTLYGAIARIYEPGCKFDTVLLLEGAQGIGKSRAIRALSKNPDWYCEMSVSVVEKDVFLQMRGKWIIEAQEMVSFKRTDIEMQKQFISKQVDTYRPPYGRIAQDYPRQCIFIATSNQDVHHDDETGYRRFYPVRCNNPIHVDELAKDVDQLWAEAVQNYKENKHSLYLPAPLEQLAIKEQMDRMTYDPWTEPIKHWLNQSYYNEVTSEQIFRGALNIETKYFTKAEQMRIGKILRILGWKSIVKREGNNVYRCWQKVVTP